MNIWEWFNNLLNTKSVPVVQPPKPPQPSPTNVARQIVGWINFDRSRVEAVSLTNNSTLNHVAQAHADEVKRTGVFSHNSSNGQTPFDRMRVYHINFGYAGEDMDMHDTTPQGIVEDMYNDIPHREIMLSKNMKYVGIGYNPPITVMDFTDNV